MPSVAGTAYFRVEKTTMPYKNKRIPVYLLELPGGFKLHRGELFSLSSGKLPLVQVVTSAGIRNGKAYYFVKAHV